MFALDVAAGAGAAALDAAVGAASLGFCGAVITGLGSG